VALIYLASSDAFYHRLYTLYNQAFYPDTRVPYITAEDITTTFDNLDIPCEVTKLRFPHTITCSEHHILENYTNQCVFDNKALGKLRGNAALNAFLESFNNGEMYCFPQQVWLIKFGAPTEITMTI